MSSSKRTGRRAAVKLATTSQASASSAFLPRALRRGKNRVAATTTAAATFEIWIKTSIKTQQMLFQTAYTQPFIFIQNDQIGVQWVGANANPNYVWLSADTAVISDGEWHHIAVVFNNNQVTFYKDGIPTNESFTMSATQTSGGDLQVGSGLGSTQAFNGRITDVRVWNVARALGDIQGFMYATLTGTESGLVALNNLSYYGSANTAIKNMVNGAGGAAAGNAKVVQVVGPQSQQPVPQNVWVYSTNGIAPLGPQISPKGLIYAENVYASNNGPGGNYLRSLDLQDHTLNWTYNVQDNSTIPTLVIPASVAVGNGTVYVGAQNLEYNFGTFVELHGVNATTGQALWPRPTIIGARSFACRPVVSAGRVVIGINAIATETTVNTVLASVNATTGAYVPGLVIQTSADPSQALVYALDRTGCGPDFIGSRTGISHEHFGWAR